MTTVCLFDIDGTLLDSGGAGQHAMEQALCEVFGLTGPFAEIPAAGRTDRAITTDLFAQHDLTVDEPLWARFLEAYLDHLPRSLNRQSGLVLPGVVSLLEELAQREDVTLGLLTGNLEQGALLKLRHYQLDHHFRFGGYGDRHLDRDDVARSALTAATDYLQREPPTDRVWVIGDTPSDVRCARAIGARAMAVATGLFNSHELKECRPDAQFDSFANVASVIQQLTG